MDALSLNDSEHKFFEELFQTCDLGKTSKIPKIVVGELLATSGLPTDVLLQVSLDLILSIVALSSVLRVHRWKPKSEFV